MTALLGPVVIVAGLFRVPQGPHSIYARCVRLWARTVNWSAGVRVRVHGERMPAGQRRGLRRQPRELVRHLRARRGGAVVQLRRQVGAAKDPSLRLRGAGASASCSSTATTGSRRSSRTSRRRAKCSAAARSSSVRRERAASTIICVRSRRARSCSPSRRRRRSSRRSSTARARSCRRVRSAFAPASSTFTFSSPIPTAGLDYEHRSELMTTRLVGWPTRCIVYTASASAERAIAAAGERQE